MKKQRKEKEIKLCVCVCGLVYGHFFWKILLSSFHKWRHESKYLCKTGRYFLSVQVTLGLSWWSSQKCWFPLWPTSFYQAGPIQLSKSEKQPRLSGQWKRTPVPSVADVGDHTGRGTSRPPFQRGSGWRMSRGDEQGYGCCSLCWQVDSDLTLAPLGEGQGWDSAPAPPRSRRGQSAMSLVSTWLRRLPDSKNVLIWDVGRR